MHLARAKTREISFNTINSKSNSENNVIAIYYLNLKEN